MADSQTPIVNVDDVEEHEHLHGDHFGGYYKVLTPTMKPGGGALGVNLTRLPPGRALCPFHYHQLEDEVFYIVSGTGVLRYGDEIFPVQPGDCISCPAGTQTAHQIANTGNVDLTYLAIGRNDPNEVAGYPDTGKVMVRSLQRVGYLEKTEYMDGEPNIPEIFALAKAAGK